MCPHLTLVFTLLKLRSKNNLFFSPGKYYIATMTMITASTSLTIFIMNIHFCGAEAKPVPHWAKVLIIDYMSKIFFVYEVGENCTTPESKRTPLYPEEPLPTQTNDKYCFYDDCYYDGIYHHDRDLYKYSNGHSGQDKNKHHKAQANGSRKHHYNNHVSSLERGEATREPTQHYHHITRDQLDYQAPSQPQNLQHLNGGLKEQLLYPSEKYEVPACPCCCPCLQHNQVNHRDTLFLPFTHFTYLSDYCPSKVSLSAYFGSAACLFLRW